MVSMISSFFSRIMSRGICGSQRSTEFWGKAEVQQGPLSSHIKLLHIFGASTWTKMMAFKELLRRILPWVTGILAKAGKPVSYWVHTLLLSSQPAVQSLGSRNGHFCTLQTEVLSGKIHTKPPQLALATAFHSGALYKTDNKYAFSARWLV